MMSMLTEQTSGIDDVSSRSTSYELNLTSNI